MIKSIQKNIVLLGTVCLLAVLLTVFAYAEEDEYAYLSEIIDSTEERGTEVELLSAVTGAAVPANTDPVYLGGTRIADGYLMDGRMYVDAAAFCAAVDPEGPAVSVAEGGQYLEWNGRCFWLDGGAYAFGGETLVPLDLLASCCGASTYWDAETWNLTVVPGSAACPAGGETFYDSEDLSWLSRIIFAEAGNQPLAGQIGVGNVVLNRVASSICPDTVYGVIFDNRFGVQFTPTENGSIYLEPSEEAIAAAKLCLEGVNTVGDSLYFVNPSIGSTSWFRARCTFVCAIGQHEFYA